MKVVPGPKLALETGGCFCEVCFWVKELVGLVSACAHEELCNKIILKIVSNFLYLNPKAVTLLKSIRSNVLLRGLLVESRILLICQRWRTEEAVVGWLGVWLGLDLDFQMCYKPVQTKLSHPNPCIFWLGGSPVKWWFKSFWWISCLVSVVAAI